MNRKAAFVVWKEETVRHSLQSVPAQTETALLRVLWMIAQGMVWPWLLESFCHRDSIQYALDANLIWPPLGEHLGYHITDAGRQLIADWYYENGSGRTAPSDLRQWRAVTLR